MPRKKTTEVLLTVPVVEKRFGYMICIYYRSLIEGQDEPLMETRYAVDMLGARQVVQDVFQHGLEIGFSALTKFIPPHRILETDVMKSEIPDASRP